MEWGRGRGRGKKGTTDGKYNATSAIPRRFEDACAQIQKSLENYTAKHESSSDDSEDEQENESILQKVFHAYEGESKGHSERTEQFLSESLTSGGIVCLICIDAVKKAQAIWSCVSCYGIFHLPCIQKWATDSIQIQKIVLEESVSTFKPNIQWFCPKCRKEYASEEKPTTYVCFCTKTKNPSYDAWLVPHSCGQVCGKNLKPYCGHSCLLLCHPGPCPPCAQTVRETCFCGKQQPTVRRCGRKGWSCSKSCNHKLLCGQHLCDKICHQGECPACPKQSLQKCQCGREKVKRPCTFPKWQCENVCGKPFSCKSHNCEVKCHERQCGNCPQSGPRTCPCGKTEFNLPCTQKIPPCGDTCDKLLECGIHRCAQRCHVGVCGNCLQVQAKRCRCGAKEKSIPCFKDFTCDTKCKNTRNCKKHTCSRKCCEGDCPPCEQICNRTLPCKNHKCNNQCHQGPCYPCPLMIEVSCNCEATKFKVPCGREKVTKPPKCKQQCRALPVCAHPSREPHACHFGPCPQCKQICGKPLNCGHKCPAKCHDNVLVKIQSDKKRAGPWEPIPVPKIEVKTFVCPPCQVPMPLDCFGNHVKHNFACSEIKPWSCGRKCGQNLNCTNHTCNLECHVVKDTGSNCKPCEESCSKPKPKGCTHPCLKQCHTGPCSPCHQMSLKTCHCQLNSVYIECSKWTFASIDVKQTMLCCENKCPKEMACGHRCPLICHSGSCPNKETCKKRITIRCPCKHLKKEIICNSKADKKSLKCDSSCVEQQKRQSDAKLHDDEEKQKAEVLKQQQELEEYARKYEGKKKRNRKTREYVEEEKSEVPYKLIIVGALFSVVAIAMAVYFAL